jgi:shikimate dehydrogenase
VTSGFYLPRLIVITGQTKLLGVIGYPIAHSLSPIMHNAAISQVEVDYAYLPFAIRPQDLERAVAGLYAIGVEGFSVTIPHKQAIIPLLVEVSPIAQAIGAVNTVWRTDSGWQGTNTDVEGFLAPLQAMHRDWSETTAVILGNGGAARAAVAGCAQLGCAQIQVVGRDSGKLEEFVHSWLDSPLTVNLQVHNWTQLPKLLSNAGLLVNSTPIGMAPKAGQSPLTSAEVELLPSNLIAYDLIYTPNPTMFLQQAKEQGATIVDGLEMLVRQGATALELWLNRSVPVDVMRQALQEKLGLR